MVFGAASLLGVPAYWWSTLLDAAQDFRSARKIILNRLSSCLKGLVCTICIALAVEIMKGLLLTTATTKLTIYKP